MHRHKRAGRSGAQQSARCLLLVIASCASAPAPPRETQATAAVSSTAAATPSASPSSSASVAAPPDPPPVELLPFTRVLEAPVHSLAFGKKRMAAIGKDVWMHQGKGWTKLAALPQEAGAVRIFFGRDDQPRLMGAAPGPDSAAQSVYLRWKDAGWRLAKYELGRIATGPDAPLFGVLGHDNPEVVCKQGAGCLVKRLSGWTDIDGLPGAPFVELCGELTWAYEGREVWRLEPKGWARVTAPPTFERADGLWSISATDVWVAERSNNALHHFDGTKWTREPSPIAGPRALWAPGAGDVWLAGDGGAAHHDGQAWRRVSGPPQNLALVSGRSAGDVWLGGDGGLWQGKRAADR